MGKMGNCTTIIYDEIPEFKKPILIEGLPGVGNVGKIAADFIAEKLNAVRFATVYSDSFPPQVTLDNECVIDMACNELYYAKAGDKDIILLLGEYQGTTPEGQYLICEDLMKEVFIRFDVSRIITLGGYGTGKMADSPRVLGAVSDAELKEDLEKHGVVFSPGEPAGGIVGASALLVGFGKIYGIPSQCLMGETSGYFVDYKSGIALLNVLESILGIELDKSELNDKCQQIDELTAKVKEMEAGQQKHADLGYIG